MTQMVHLRRTDVDLWAVADGPSRKALDGLGFYGSLYADHELELLARACAAAGFALTLWPPPPTPSPLTLPATCSEEPAMMTPAANGRPATDSQQCPKYVAVTGCDDYLEAADDLEALLAVLVRVSEPGSGEDAAVWDGTRLAAVVLEDGTVVRYDRGGPGLPLPAPAPAVPARPAALTQRLAGPARRGR